MPLTFREDSDGDLRCSGYATVEHTSDNPTVHVVDDLGRDDLPGPNQTLIIEDGKEAFTERVGGGSRHATSDQVTWEPDVAVSLWSEVG